jgi:hypothetical protein
MPAIEIVLQRPRHAILRLMGGTEVRQANRAIAEIGERLGDSLTGTVVMLAPASWKPSLADRFLVRGIENLVALEGGSFRLVT